MFVYWYSLITPKAQQEIYCAGYLVFDHQILMASSNFDNGLGNKRRKGSSSTIHNTISSLHIPDNKRNFKMGETIAWKFLNFVGLPAYVLGVMFNLDNVKSSVLFFLGLIYAMIKVYYIAIEKAQNKRSKDLELWHAEQDKIDRIHKQNHIKK